LHNVVFIFGLGLASPKHAVQTVLIRSTAPHAYSLGTINIVTQYYTTTEKAPGKKQRAAVNRNGEQLKDANPVIA
jgi:hypothetical protein